MSFQIASGAVMPTTRCGDTRLRRKRHSQYAIVDEHDERDQPQRRDAERFRNSPDRSQKE